MIDKKELKKILVKFLSEREELHSHLKSLKNMIGIDYESHLISAILKLEASQIELIEKMAGCNSDCLYWYVYENNCGSKGMEAGIDDDMREIRTVDDLVWIITEHSEIIGWQ